MGSNVVKKRKARESLATRIASSKELVLTPDICEKIVLSGGPTFRTTAGGHICYQTGKRLKRGQCQSYSARILNGTPAMVAFRAAKAKIVEHRLCPGWTPPPSPPMKTLEWDESAGNWQDCPCCHRQVNVYETGERYHSYCGNTFMVVRKQQPVGSIKFYGSKYYACPHCERATWIDCIGTDTCEKCGKRIEAIR